ncbi:hypothetical protein Dxin01_00776 [Deinococcus xinjiangensis]|uniref:Uncharacterized protein n=1 Tax=Deinococcus xinjiangensis TaxID=457454 RepID=A0ABP9V6Y3_9DEIO
MKIKWFLLAALTHASAAVAQDQNISITEAAKLIGQAQGTLLIYAPTMQSPEITSGYRKAIGKMVTVTIITSPQAVANPTAAERVMPVAFAGYESKNTTVYAPTIKNLNDSVPFVVVDRKFALAGINLVQVPLPGDAAQIKLIRTPATVNSLASWVIANAKANTPVDLLKWFGRHIQRQAK